MRSRRPRSSTRCAAGRCWPTSSTPGRAPRTAPPAAARSSSTRRRSRRSSTSSPIARTFALQDEPRGTGDAVGAALAVVPDEATEILVLSGDVPLVTGADLDAVLEARREDDAAIALASVFAADPAAARARRAQRVRDGRADRRGERRDARGAGRQRGQRRPVRVRCRLAAPPDRGPDAVARDRRAVPDRPRPARPRGRPASSARSRSRTTAGSTASTTARSWPRPSGACGSGSTRRTCAPA